MKIGAYAVERDYSHYTPNSAKTVLAVIGTASRGEENKAVVCTSAQDLYNKFGPAKEGYYGLYAANYFLSQSSKVYFVRATTTGAAYAKASVDGLDADGEDLSGAIIIEFQEKGTHYNGAKLEVSEITAVKVLSGNDVTITTIKTNPDGTESDPTVETRTKTIMDKDETIRSYDLVIKSAEGSTIEGLKGINLEKLELGTTTGYLKITQVDKRAARLQPKVYQFENGDDGVTDDSLAMAAAYIEAAKALQSDTLDMNLIATPGVTDHEVISYMLSLAENRGDCLYLVDPPYGLTRDGIINWHNGEGDYTHAALNSSYGALYFDWVSIYDSFNKKRVEVPPSVVVAASYAYSDRISELWYAPAGLTRGLVRGALEAKTKLSKTDIEELYGDTTAGSNCINAIYEDPQVGLVLWGQKTLARDASALNRVNVRRLLAYLKRVVTNVCNYLTFEPNDRMTWNSFEMRVKPLLEGIKNRRGIYEYRIVKGDTIVSAEDIDNYRMPCMILVRPTKAAEEIPIYFVLTSTGADFNEVLEANGVITE